MYDMAPVISAVGWTSGIPLCAANICAPSPANRLLQQSYIVWWWRAVCVCVCVCVCVSMQIQRTVGEFAPHQMWRGNHVQSTALHQWDAQLLMNVLGSVHKKDERDIYLSGLERGLTLQRCDRAPVTCRVHNSSITLHGT